MCPQAKLLTSGATRSMSPLQLLVVRVIRVFRELFKKLNAAKELLAVFPGDLNRLLG